MKPSHASKFSAFLKIVVSATFIFFFSWLFAYKIGVNDLAIQSEDSLPAMLIPVAIIKEGTIYLDSYYDTLIERYPHPDDKDYRKGLVPFYLRRVQEPFFEHSCSPRAGCPKPETHYVSAFPIITPILALPIYLIPVLLGIPINFETVTVLGHLSSAFIIALSGGCLYLLLKKHFFSNDENRKLLNQHSLLLTFIYLFATINFAHISQALWQHGTLQLFTILALWAFYEKRHFLLGFWFGLMLLSRPTSGIAVFFLGFLALIQVLQLEKEKYKKSANLIFRVFLGVLPSILFFLWYNRVFYGDISNQGYANQIFTEWKGRFPEGFLGLWISPSKGLLVYSPVFVFSLVGLYFAVKNWRENLDYVAFGLIVLVHTLVLGKWKHWYGGWSFGYRMASDIIPFLVLLLVPFLKSPLFMRAKVRKIFLGSLIFSVFVQVLGIFFFDGIWHSAYDLGYENTSWLWSLKNSEAVFNIRRVLVKFGLRNSVY